MGAAPAGAVATSERHDLLTSVQHDFSCQYTTPRVAGHAFANSKRHTAAWDSATQSGPARIAHLARCTAMKWHITAEYSVKQPSLLVISLGSRSTWWHLAHHLFGLVSRCRPLSLKAASNLAHRPGIEIASNADLCPAKAAAPVERCIMSCHLLIVEQPCLQPACQGLSRRSLQHVSVSGQPSPAPQQ